MIRIQNWQDFILHFYVKERERRARYMAALDNSRGVEKSQGILDSCVRLLCDLLMMAIRIGLPVGPPELLSPMDSHLPMMSYDSICRDFADGSRQMGALALRDTILFLRLKGEKGLLNTQATGLEVLYQVMIALKSESENALSKSSAKDNMLTATSVKILHLNIMLTACVILDFITVPILQGFFKEDQLMVDEAVSDGIEDVLSLDENPSCQKFASHFKTFIPKFGRNSQLAWTLINTLLDILAPLENVSDWIMAEQTYKRQVQAGLGDNT